MLRGWCDLRWQDFYQGIIIFCHPTITRLFQKSIWMKLFVLIIFKVRGRYNHGTTMSTAGIIKGTLCVLFFLVNHPTIFEFVGNVKFVHEESLKKHLCKEDKYRIDIEPYKSETKSRVYVYTCFFCQMIHSDPKAFHEHLAWHCLNVPCDICKT